MCKVTPLVGAAYDVLRTTRNISVLLAIIQVLTALLQLLTVITLVGLLICVNPDLKEERKALVTPVVRYLSAWVMPGSEGRWILKVTGWTLFAVWLFALSAAAYYFSYKDREASASMPTTPIAGAENGSDVKNLKDGKSNQ